MRIYKLCWVQLCLVLMGTIAIGQDLSIEKANEANDAWLHVANTQNCNACHRESVGRRTSFGTGAELPWGTALEFVRSANAISYDISIDQPNGVGLACGQYLISELKESLLRTHLRLGERPALVVMKAINQETTLFEAGDILLATNDEPVENVQVLRAKMDQDPKFKVQVKLLREGREVVQTVLASELGTPPKVYRIGVRVEAPSDAMRSQLNLLEGEGLQIVEVLDEPLAKATGLQVHDIMLRAGEARLASVEELKKSVNQSQGNEIAVTLLRKGKEIIHKVVPYAAPEPQANVTRVNGAGQMIWSQCPVYQLIRPKLQQTNLKSK